jgi:hypothetical protein
MIPSRRHARGRSHIASVLNWWLARSDLSHNQMERICDWSMGESGLLTNPQISLLRNSKIAKPSYRNLEGLGAVNHAIWLWQTKGQQEAQQAYGPYSTHSIDPRWLDGAVWLAHPDEPTTPLEFADWCELFVGLLELPYIETITVSPTEAKDLSAKLGDLLNMEISNSGLGFRQSLEKLLSHYPTHDRGRIDRLRNCILGEFDYNGAQLEAEAWDLASMIGQYRGLGERAFSPQDLYATLTSGRGRS